MSKAEKRKGVPPVPAARRIQPDDAHRRRHARVARWQGRYPEAILAEARVLRARAREMGMRTLREDGIRKVLAGMTTPEEVISATMGDKE